MTISNSGSDERGGIYNGKAGDQTGGEWRVRSWYNGGWDVVLRHPDANVREMIATMAEKAAKNDAIGYDQIQRLTFWAQLAKVGYKPEGIKTKCEADCSAGVAAIVKGAGYRLANAKLKSLNHDSYTGNLRSRLKAVGFEALTTSKYLTSDKYLERGDILLNDKGGGHTCINLTDGSGIKKAASNAVDYTVRVTAKVLNVRDGAGTSYKINAAVKKGEAYDICAEQMNGSTKWGKIKSGAGWISLAYAEKVTATKKSTKSIDQVAREVCEGKWKNGSERKALLIAAGYDYNAVQAAVNKMLK